MFLEVCSIVLLEFLILMYIIFCLKRNGLHLLKVGWMVGLGLWFVASILMLAYYNNNPNVYPFIKFGRLFSWRGMCWIYASVVLIILGQEIICFIAKGNNLPQKETIIKWKALEWPYYYHWLIGLIGIYMLICIVQYYKFVPDVMMFFRRPNLLQTTTSDIPKVFHIMFFQGASGLLKILFLKSLIGKNWRVLCVTSLMLLISVLFCPLSRTFLLALVICYVILPSGYYFLFRPQLKIKSLCLTISFVLFFIYLANQQRKITHSTHISGFQRFSVSCASTLGCLKIEDKPKFGLFFTQRALKRLIHQDTQLPSLGMYCTSFQRGLMTPTKELYVARNDKTSASINYIGQADLYFSWWGMLCFLLLGLIIGLLDYWYSQRIATISYSLYFCLFFTLCQGLFASSMFESTIVKNGCFSILLLSIYEHVIRKKIVEKRK
ncbi:MAG: hypothetical protein LBB19_03495 [Puniceicoccales bacterium]|jgi:hypothetical protein|nr:hypothetical protein [Puniceicoccales bacterium]